MNKEDTIRILEIKENARTDKEYLQRYAVYEPTEKRLRELMEQLCPEHRRILEEYLCASVELHHRLMVLAIQYTP